jgi:very-short-patch-repair endonuclease
MIKKLDIKQLEEKYPELIKGQEYNGNTTKLKWICPIHGEYEQSLYVHSKGHGCFKCAHDKIGLNKRSNVESFIEKANDIHNGKYDYSKVEYKNNKSKVCIICPEHGEYWQTPGNHLTGYGCKKCAQELLNKKNTKSIKYFEEKANDVHNKKYDYSKSVYITAKEKICIICPEHGEYWMRPCNHTANKQGCPKCAHIGSKMENNIKEYIESLGIKTISNYRELGFEIDIYCPDYKIGIEFDGLHWHSEEFVEKNYHLNKTNKCQENGIRLIHIFEDEWSEKQEIVKSRIENIFGKTPNKIYARKCDVRYVTFKKYKEFMNNNHIQGQTSNGVAIGLYYNNNLLSCMSFCTPRVDKNKNGFELIRFANMLHTTVVGGAEKLLTFFIKNYEINEIISYADLRWSQGELYKKLGFTLDHQSKPNYFNIINNKRENRFKYRKSELIKQGFDSNKSEHEIMLERGIYRIYDCGTLVFKLKIPQT